MKTWGHHRAAVALAILIGLASAGRAQEPGEGAPGESPRDPGPQAAGPGADERIRALEARVADLEGRGGVAALDTSAPAAPSVLGVVSALAEQVKVTGVISAGYGWNVNDPPGRRGTNLLRVNDPDHDTFAVTWAKLGVYRDASGENAWDAGFRLELAAGREVETTLSLDPDFNGGSTVNAANAYVSLQAPTPLGRPLTLTAGRFYGWFGVESLDVPLNPNFSLSYFSNFTPFTNTGVSASLELVDGLRYTQYVVNGWDLVFDNNDAKSYGGQLALSLDDATTVVALNWLAGCEQADDESDVRWLVELDLTTKLTDTTELRAALHYGQEEGAAIGGGVAKYGGALLIVRQEFLDVLGDDGEVAFRRLALAARGAFWRDQGGSKSGLEQTLADGTLTFEVRFTKHASLRLEWRHDHSTEAFFLGGRGDPSQHHQDTVAAELSFRF